MKRTRKQRLFSILLVISMIMQQTFVLPAVAEDHVETETAAAVTQTAEAPETKAAKTEVQEQKAPETQAPVTEAPKPEVQETKETPAPATEAPKPEVQETQETPAPATEAPVTEAPQTEAPVTEAPQTEAPVTEAPQTEAPVTEAPQTEAPVTEAPETEAPVTEAPETEAPVTEAPETEAPATEAPETETEIKETETETESETESETETEAPKTHFTYEDGRVRITADASESAKLPQDAVLKADYLAPGSAAYNAAVAKVKAAYGLGDDVELECAPYDIYFVSKGNRIEPENGTVKVTIQFVKPVLGEAEGDLIDKGIAHIKDNGSVEDLNGSVNTNAQGAVSSVGFTTDSFSVFAPFTVSQVTAQAATSSNLNQFVTNVVFDNNLYDADGALVLHPNSEYSFKMEFAESIDKGLFEKEGVLTYTFPAQLTPAGAGGTFDMNITAGETQYTLSGNTYTIEGNTIKVSFNKDGGAAYEALKAASNAEFWLSLRAKVDANASGDKIKFGDSVEKTVKFDNTAAVSVEKSGSYDKTSGKMNYTVKVKSTGTSTNVKVTDVITGTLLTYDKNVTATSNQKGALTVDPNATAKGNGFEYTIPSMSDGEEVTFSYSASVDYSKLSGDKFTADETKNTVTAKGDNTDEVSKDHNFDHTMAYDTGITKSGTKGEITNGWQTSNWTITVNADAKTDVGGSLVTDKIQENKKVPTKYSGAGITVKKYKADGTLVSSEPIPWDQLKSHSDTTWSYELPQKDGTPYKYEISYTTTSDISKTTENTSVTNHAEFDGKGTDGSVGVEGQNQFGVTKTHAAPSKDGVNWTVDVTIPNCGFNESFTITDALPFTWTGGYHADSYKEGSLQIAMNGQTIAADNYDIKYTAPVTEGHNKSSGSIQVVFKPEKLAGLFPATTGTERVLTMTYTTIPDSTWPDGENHTNTVTATGDGTSKNASDSYILKEHEISKSVENGNATIGGMPAYKFKIYLRGVDTDTLEIHDIFDPDLFEIVTTDSNSYNNAQFGAGDESWIADNGANGSSNGGTLTVTPTETGATFSIKNVATKSGGAYYSWYSIRYYLKVKDAEALKKIQQEAAKNPDHTTKIGNTAEWEGKSTGEVSVDYKVNPLTKTETGSPNKLNHYTSTFTVVVNPDKLQLNGGNDLTVTDTFSDAMELVTDSVQITLEPEGTSSWDFDTDKKGLTVTIPDECKATITYQAQIIGTGTVTYKNNVTVTGNYTASTGDKTAQITTDGEGSAEHFQYKVIKRDAHDKQKRLQGAIFQLFELTDGSETAVKNNKTGGDVTFTTDANGEFMMAGAYQADGWELTKGHTYVLKEIQAPEGYKKADPLTFTVGSITADGAHGNGYTFDIYDEEGKDIDISVVKTWNDADNQDGKRPESVMVQLYANGHPQSDPVELNAGNNWSYKWEKLPDKENGELIAYTVRELQRNEDGSMTPVDDRAKITYLVNNENVTYEVGYSNTDNAWTISNTHTPATIGASVEKIWDDNDNQDGKRPEKLLVTLMRRIREQAVPISLDDADDADTNPAEEVKTVELTAAHNWKASVSNLPKYKDGQMYEYFWTEKEDNIPNGYKLTNEVTYNILSPGEGVTGFITRLTNSHKPQKINAIVKKVWDDNENQDGKRASELTVELMRNGTEVAGTVTLNEENNWTDTVENLDKYTGGVENGYTWVEKNLPEGYSLTDTKKEVTEATENTLEAAITTLTNSYTPGKVEASVLKVWNDGENQDGIRPSEITVTLVKNNEPTTQSVTLSEVNHWTAAITGLDEYTNGTLNEYTWKEAEVPDGYTLTNTKKEGRLTTLTNTHTPEVVNATIRKTWNDSDNQDGVRPTEIKVDLKKNDQVIQTVTLDTANGWETTVEDLPKYTAGVENIYTWAEQEDGLPEGYELTGDVTVGEVTTLTNTRVPDTVSVGVRKIWNDAENQDGIRPSELRVDLLKNGELTGQYVILNEENGWTAMITDLPKNTAVAEPNVYTWSEELPDGYTVTVSDPDEMGITTLTNTHTPAVIEASVEKTWDDNDDQDGKRPEKLFVTLMRRIREQAVPISLDDVGTNPAEEVKTVELTAANDWKASVSDLPKYSDGQMYEYFWTEKEDNIPDGYELTNEVTYDILSPGKGVTGFITTLTNTHTPQKINAVVKKVWDDKDNQDGKRPTELTVDLMRNGTEVAGTVTLNEENGWTDTVENLDKYTGGVENVYTWAEKNLPEGYSLTDTKKEVTEATEDTLEAAITTLTNKHTPGKVSASILKIWDDAKNQDGKRPETITAILVKNGEETDQKVTLSADNEWSAIIKDLDEYTNGTLNKYTWKEAEVPEGYELTLNKTDGTFTTLTNTHVPELVNVSVRKEWDDADNQDGIRPAELKVDLKKNGEVIATVTLNEENSWSDGVKDLPKYTAGVENIYTWAEQEDGLPEGYELTDTKTEELLAPPMEGEEVLPTETVSIITTLTNTHTPETVNIEGAKTWADSGNESARPESITIRIYADGEELTDLAKTVTADDDWKWSFTDLPKYKEGEVGQEITYTITEDPVDGYISEVDGYDVTNTRSAAVSKVDIGTGEELTGAHFQVLDGAGNIVDEWDSESGTNHVIKGIETDVEYTLHESKAPEGYEVTADVTFTVAKDGTVTATASVVNGVIIVEDKLKPSENTSTTIEKKITYNGLELFAENLSFYVRLFYDKECTKPATELKEIKIVNAMSGKVTFDNLEAGRTYYAGECDADGNVMYSGVLEDGTVYTPVFTGTNGQVVTVEEGENKVVYLDNQLQSWPHNFYAKGTLTVTKKLLGADGEAKDSDEVFYAGIFDDPEYTTLSERVEYNLLELDMSGGSETSMSTNVQIESLDSVTTLYVTEVDEDGNPVKGAPGFAYEVSADKTEVNIDPKHTKAEVTITNKEKSYEGRLTVTKKLVTEDGRAKDSDETFYAGIFDDADFTQLSDKVEENILTLALNGASEVTAQTKVKVDSADSVTTLYVTEVDVDGNPVKEMAGFKYGVSVDKEEVEIAAGREASVIITNVELPHNPYQHGELTVTKKLLGADGKPKNSNGVFYAGIFDDPEYTTLSDKVEYNVLELDLNGNAEASAMTKVDIAKKDSTVTLYVTEVDEEGNPIAGAAGFKYEVSVDQTKVDLTAERSKAVVVITNKEVPETESETQPTTKPTKGVKTGDDTPIGGYAGLMAIAFAAFALLVVSEQKRRKSGRE